MNKALRGIVLNIDMTLTEQSRQKRAKNPKIPRQMFE
jgi:hypothetical protein